MSAPRIDDRTLDETLLALVRERGPGKTACPSEAARRIAGSDEKVWRLLMKPIRARAVALAQEGRLVITRKGRPVDPADFRGIYRLGLPASPEGAHGQESGTSD